MQCAKSKARGECLAFAARSLCCVWSKRSARTVWIHSRYFRYRTSFRGHHRLRVHRKITIKRMRLYRRITYCPRLAMPAIFSRRAPWTNDHSPGPVWASRLTLLPWSSWLLGSSFFAIRWYLGQESAFRRKACSDPCFPRSRLQRQVPQVLRPKARSCCYSHSASGRLTAFDMRLAQAGQETARSTISFS